MQEDSIRVLKDTLKDTLKVCEDGSYKIGEKEIQLKLSLKEMKEAHVFLPEDIEALKDFSDFEHVHRTGRCNYDCVDKDSFSLVRERYRVDRLFGREKDKEKSLVLNFANPTHPGGAVRSGERAQEEDLCRVSSLLLSLEGPDAKVYYEYNRTMDTCMGSDAVLITPKVEIIKDEKGTYLEDSVVVAVMTCAAPCIRDGYEGLSEEQYEEILYRRIQGMLRCAAYMGYDALVLGAFGCGAFGNDAKVVSDLFYKALKEFDFDGMKENEMFRRIDFAVLSSGTDKYNYNEFFRNFGKWYFYRDEEEKARQKMLHIERIKEMSLDSIRGAMVGGAAGDALGYTVEFMSDNKIVEKYGACGITEYELDKASGKALISDDTQMALFTANGILYGETRCRMRGIGGPPSIYMPKLYQDWLTTQEVEYETGRGTDKYGRAKGFSWLLDVPELYNRRAPGETCLSALRKDREENFQGDYLKEPRNNSKGCGGIMRVAPLGLRYSRGGFDYLDEEGAIISAITHGHPLGYLPSAVLTHILYRIVYPIDGPIGLREVILEAKENVRKLFKDTNYMDELCEIIDNAIALAENDDSDKTNIKRLGEGWVAEETLAIAIYCSLRYEHDFSGGIIAAVNHDGDSDSTGAVVGNILGAINGYEAMEEKWKTNLELLDVILEISEDLYHGCRMSEYDSERDPDWVRKYTWGRWKETEESVL